MAFVPLKFAPGVRLDDSALASEGGWTDIDHCRWSRGQLQPIGGYAKMTQATFDGIARGAHAWVNLAGDAQLAWGTHAKLYAYPGGDLRDITAIDNAPIPGRIDGVGGSGYGAGSYGSGGYGMSDSGSIHAQVWHLGNFGQNLVALFADGGLYEWQPSMTLDAVELIANGDFTSGSGWLTGTGWSIGTGVATASAGTASNLTQVLASPPSDGRVYRLTANVTRSAGTMQMRLGAVDIGAPISATGAVSIVFPWPSGQTTLNLYKDAAFAGSIDNVSIKLETRSYLVTQAPARSTAMLVDPNGFVILLGTSEADGDWNPLLIRWCSQQNLRAWVPDTDNTAREVAVARGSRLVGGIATRGQNLIWTDTDVYSMQFTGDATYVFSVRPMGTGCGLIGPHAAAEADGAVFWMSNSGQFFMSNGQSVQAIDCPVKAEIFANLAPGQNDKIYAWVNGPWGEVWWSYADLRDGIECSRYVGYNWRENYWIVGTFARSSWVPAGIFSAPVGFSTDGRLYSHETGNSADGGVFSAHAETGAFDIEQGENYADIARIIPDFKGLQDGLGLKVYGRRMPAAPWRLLGAHVIAPTTESLLCRYSEREYKLRFEWASYQVAGRMGALTADVIKSGAKR